MKTLKHIQDDVYEDLETGEYHDLVKETDEYEKLKSKRYIKNIKTLLLIIGLWVCASIVWMYYLLLIELLLCQ